MVLTRACLYQLREPYGSGSGEIAEEIGGKIAVDTCPVRESDALADDDGCAVAAHRHYGHARAEQEERDAPLVVELAYLREDGEGRVVDDDTVFGVFGILVVATRIEGTEHLFAGHVVHLANILKHRLVHVLRGVGVVCCLRSVFELGHVALVVAENDGVLAAAFQPFRLLLLFGGLKWF